MNMIDVNSLLHWRKSKPEPLPAPLPLCVPRGYAGHKPDGFCRRAYKAKFVSPDHLPQYRTVYGVSLGAAAIAAELLRAESHALEGFRFAAVTEQSQGNLN